MSASAPASGALPAAAAAASRLPGAAPASTVRCENCGTPVTARYCGACGQKLEAPVHSLWHFMQLAAEDLTHADSRLWRTLAALLFRPGFLTREFLHGRRARYLPPLRLYLVLSVVFFVVAGTGHRHFTVLEFDESKPVSGSKLTLPGQDAALAVPKANETPQQRADRRCANANYDGPWAGTLQPLFNQACRKSALDNGHGLQTEFLHNVPRAMFVFLPLLAGLMMLMYWWPRHYYVEHLLLFLHNHACVFLVAAMLLLMGTLVPRVPGLQLAIFVYFAWYMYRSMRVVYRQGRLLTASKLALLASFYLVFAAVMLAATSIYSAVML
jgi:hypothetical protein